MKPTGNRSAHRIGRLHVITNTTLQSRWSAEEIARLAIEGGADTIQYRDKQKSTRAMAEEARTIAGFCRRRRIPLLVNDRVDVAVAVDAQGVHLGDDDLPLSVAREILGPERILGASSDNADEANERARETADYAGIGPVFATSSKDDTGPVLGLDGLARAVSLSGIPLIAIGGITLENLPSVLETGVHGIAVLSEVCCAEDPATVTKAMRDLIDAYPRRAG